MTRIRIVARRLGVFAAAFALTLCSAAQAQTPAPQKPPKQPPAPLFPRHRRGIYRNNRGINVVDATPQSPPLATDDPGVPDTGEWELNFSTASDRTTDVHHLDVLRADLNYGMEPTIAGHKLPTQLKLEFPISGVRNQGEPFAFGPGTVEAGIKFNFYNNEHAGLSFALYPQIEFEPPFSDSAGKGIAEPGEAVVLPLLVGKQFHTFIVVGNVGLEQPIHTPKGSDGVGSRGFYSVAFGRAITRRLAAMIELRGESAFADQGERLTAINAGVIRGVRNVIIYANAGRSLSSSDGFPHTYLGVGLKLLLDPDKKNKSPLP